MALPRAFTETRIPRHWVVRGAPNTGKSTFLTALRGPVVVIDADHRARELAGRGPADIWPFSTKPHENTDPYLIAQILMRDAEEYAREVRTIAVDSVSGILTPIIARAMAGNKRGENKNKVAAFVEKAQVLRLIQDPLAATGCDIVYIWHEETAFDNNAKRVTHQTVPDTERKRLQRSLNALLVADIDAEGRRRLRIGWSRSGHGQGQAFVDTVGGWVGIPEQIDAALAGAARQEVL